MATNPGNTAELPRVSLNRYKTEFNGRKYSDTYVNVDGIQIVFDGKTGFGDPHRYTYFGKRHLLGHAGGKADQKGGHWQDKAQRVFGKRVDKVSNYGRKEFKEGGRNTVVFIDRIGEQAMAEAFAYGLQRRGNHAYPGIPHALHAEIWFGAECVYMVDKLGDIRFRGKGIEVGYVRNGDVYAIVHMGNNILTS